MPATTAKGWSVLFLPAPSPGQVIRYLERRHRRAGEVVPDGLRLSDAAGPKRVRALVGPIETRGWMASIGSLFSAALSGPVTHLWRDDAPSFWGWTIWEASEMTGHAESPLSATPPQKLLARLTGSPSPEILWARQRGLPVERVTAAARKARVELPIIDYVTVARLDQKSLLVEDSPRLYRFDFPSV